MDAGLMGSGVNLSLQPVANEIEPADVRKYLQVHPDVSNVHDLFVWAMSTTETVRCSHESSHKLTFGSRSAT